MEPQELISKLQELKQIKPRQEWVVLTKINMFGPITITAKEHVNPRTAWSFANVLGLFYQRKLAYAFTAFLFIFVGIFTFLHYGLPQKKNVKVASQSISAADLAIENTLKNNVKDFKMKSQNLAQVAQSKSPGKSPVVSLAIKEVKDAAKNLTDTIQKNPQLAKTIALDVNNNKTLLDIPGGTDAGGLKQVSDDLYKTLVQQLIKDEQGMTLTSDQKMVLDNVVSLDKQGKDSDALVNLVLLVHSTDSNNGSTSVQH
jgi:hypothetical protein